MKKSCLALLAGPLFLSPLPCAAQPTPDISGYVRQTIDEVDVPALGGVWIRNFGQTRFAEQSGIRKVGAPAENNGVRVFDRFDLGSIGKVFTALLCGRMIERRTPGFTYQTTLGQVFPNLASEAPSDYLPIYRNVPVSLFLVHSSGMPYGPAGEPKNQWMPANLTLALSDANLLERRYRYVQASVLDAPLFSPGAGYRYGGGSIVVGAMLERLTGRKFETMMQEEVLAPLGMTSSRYGRTSISDLDGTWQHTFSQGFHVPDRFRCSPQYDYQSHSPAGTLACSAQDVALFLTEWLTPSPRVTSVFTRQEMLTSSPAASPHVVGGWQFDQATGRLSHNGSNGSSYASAEILPAQGIGFAAFTNAGITMGQAAVDDLLAIMRTMERDYSALFFPGSVILNPSRYPAPAAVRLGPNKALAFARRADGQVTAFRTNNGGGDWLSSQPLPGAVFFSGLAATASQDGGTVYLAGVGSDDKLWLCRSDDGGEKWASIAPVGEGTFRSGPALAVTPDGSTVHILGLGTDRACWVASSADRGLHWNGWQPIPQGRFTSTPAALCTPEGSLHVFERGEDHRIYALSQPNWRAGWQGLSWRPTGDDFATSGPSVTLSSGGSTLYLGFRNGKRRIGTMASPDQGRSWTALSEVEEGTFTSAPVLLANDDPAGVTVLGYGDDLRLWQDRFAGGRWSSWKQVAGDIFL